MFLMSVFYAGSAWQCHITYRNQNAIIIRIISYRHSFYISWDNDKLHRDQYIELEVKCGQGTMPSMCNACFIKPCCRVMRKHV